jgi:hypothetical protein
MAAEMESLIADLLAKCYYHQAHHHTAPADSVQQMESYAPPASLEEEPLA